MRDEQKKFRIAVDVDDVLWDLCSCWLDCYNELTGENLSPTQVNSWDIEHCLNPKEPKEFWGVLSQPKVWDRIDNYIYKNTRSLLKALAENKYIDLYIVTATHPSNLKHKLPAFFRNFPFLDWKQVIICQDKSLLDMDLWVDDKPELAEELAALGKDCVLVDKGWNTECYKAVWRLNANFGINEWLDYCNYVKGGGSDER